MVTGCACGAAANPFDRCGAHFSGFRRIQISIESRDIAFTPALRPWSARVAEHQHLRLLQPNDVIVKSTETSNHLRAPPRTAQCADVNGVCRSTREINAGSKQRFRQDLAFGAARVVRQQEPFSRRKRRPRVCPLADFGRHLRKQRVEFRSSSLSVGSDPRCWSEARRARTFPDTSGIAHFVPSEKRIATRVGQMRTGARYGSTV